MKIKRFVLGNFQVNNYLVIIKDEAILIDVGSEPELIKDYLIEKNLKLKAILLTHAHLDHIDGLEYIRNKFNSPVYIHEKERDWLTNPKLNGSEYFNMDKITCKPAENLISNEQEIQLGEINIKILYTPGHSPGGLSFYIPPYVFTGDTLFYRSIGRTDLYGGDQILLANSIKNKLYKLPNNTVVYPGHDRETNIGAEKKDNYYVNS